MNSDKYFQYEEAVGETFQGVKPWLGAISPPSKVPENNPTPPSKKLVPHHVYGYRCHDCRDNIFYSKNQDELVYMSAEIGIIHQKSTNTQRFFGCGPDEKWKNSHTDDITALTLHPNKEICASGQVGKNPLIFVWRLADCEVLSVLKQGVDTRAVRTIGFSKSGKYLVTTADDNDHTVFVYDWEKGAVVASCKSGSDPIVDLDFSSADEETFATAGKNGLKFWNFDNPKDFNYKKGIFGTHKMTDMMTVKYMPGGKCLSGSFNGEIYIWSGNSCTKTIEAHSKPLTALNCRADSIVTSGRDGKLNIYDSKFALKASHDLGSSAIGIDQDDAGNIIVGLRNGGIKEVLPSGLIKTFLDSHSDGEVWGLAICQNSGYVFTCGDDNRVFAYDPKSRRVVKKGIIDEKKETKKKIVGGASTLSPCPPNQQARAVAVSKNMGHVVLGINDGTASVRKNIDNLSEEIASLEEPREWIEVIRYSPNEELLAIGCHDNFIYIYETKNYKLKNVLKGHSSYITAFDWSLDGETIQSCCGAYELLFWDVSSGKQVGSGGTAFKDTEWATNSTKFGWPIQGIFPPETDGTHINGVDISKDRQLIATADDWGHVNLYRYPCLDGNKADVYKGHSEHVVRAIFDEKVEFLYSVGGYDQTLIQWRLE